VLKFASEVSMENPLLGLLAVQLAPYAFWSQFTPALHVGEYAPAPVRPAGPPTSEQRPSVDAVLTGAASASHVHTAWALRVHQAGIFLSFAETSEVIFCAHSVWQLACSTSACTSSYPRWLSRCPSATLS
jgi:hypothetical protein